MLFRSHRKDCSNMVNASDPERFIDVYWDSHEQVSYPAEIQVQSADRPGLLAEITSKMAETEISVLSLNARTTKEDIVVINMTLEIKDTKELEKFLRDMRQLESVIDAYRVTT